MTERNKLRPTPGTIAGTRIVILRGGPPEWDGDVTAVSKTGRGYMERWDHTADLAVVYQRTEEAVDVGIERRQRGGTVVQTKKAEVYQYVGYKEGME